MSSRHAEYSVLVDWDADDDFTDTYDDVTADVRPDEGVDLAGQGRDLARGTAPPQTPSLDLVLDNDSKRYSSENSAGPLFELLLPGRDVALRATYGEDWTLNDATVTLNDPEILLGGVSGSIDLFRGWIDNLDEQPAIGERTVGLHARGKLSRLETVNVDTQLYTDVTTGEAMGYLLTAAGLTGGVDYSIDQDVIDNGRVMSYWYGDGRPAAVQARELWATEGYSAYFGERGDGVIVFLGRNYRTTADRSQTVQATYLDYDDGSSLYHTALRLVPGIRDVINVAYVEELVLRAAGSLAAIWTYPGVVTLTDGSATVTVRMDEPFTGAVTPVVTTDFTLSSGTVDVALSRTSGLVTEIQFSNATPGATISNLQLRAQTYEVTARVRADQSTDAATSILKYGRRDLALEVWPGLSLASAISLCDAMLIAYKEPRAMVEVDVANTDIRHLREIMVREVGDRVHVTNAQSGADIDVIVEQLRHRITTGPTHYLTLGCEKVVEADWALYDVDLYGTGIFGQ